MTLLFMDGFDHYASTTGVELITGIDGILKKWTNANNSTSYTSQTGRNSRGFSMRMSSGRNITSIPFDNIKTVITGFAFKASDLPTSTFDFVEFLSRSAIQQGAIQVTAAGAIRVIRSTNTQLGISSDGVVSADVWHYIEILYTVGNSDGAFDVIIDGTSVVSGSSVDTKQDNNSDLVSLQYYNNFGTAKTVDFDDLYILDDNGSTNDTFLGDVTVTTIFPDGAGNSTNFSVTGAASNYQAVDEEQGDGDTSYVSATVSGTKDTYDFESLENDSKIYGIQTNIKSRKQQANDFNIKSVTRPVTTDNLGATKLVAAGSSYDSQEQPGPGYVYAVEIQETNPDDSSEWTKTSIDATEFGYEVA